METKKSSNKDHEKNKSIFFQFGLVIALGIVLFAFEWHNDKPKNGLPGGISVPVIDTEIVIIKPTPTPKPISKQYSGIKVVKDNNIIDEIPLDSLLEPKVFVPEIITIKKTEEQGFDESNHIFNPSGLQVQPSFPGGEEMLFKYLASNCKYPQEAAGVNIQGTVYISFVVEADGSISSIHCIRSIGGGCDEEAIRLVKNMPKWEPGKNFGRPVRCSFILPVKFTLL